MTDWIALAKARLGDLHGERLVESSRTLKDLEAVFGELKQRIPNDAEPAPIFQPMVHNTNQ